MTVRVVLRMGDPRLRRVADPVREFDTPELHALIDGMIDTLRAYDGAGLAAPQLGVPLRVAIFGVGANSRYPDVAPVPFPRRINPDTRPRDGPRAEGCDGCPR